MIDIVPFQPADLPHVTAFVEAIQEEERRSLPELKPGGEIGVSYAKLLAAMVVERNGIILLAKVQDQVIGFICAWIEEDTDMLLQEAARLHAYISDIFVARRWRRRGVATQLLRAVETEMLRRRCRTIRVHAKATNLPALWCYESADYCAYEVIYSKPLD